MRFLVPRAFLVTCVALNIYFAIALSFKGAGRQWVEPGPNLENCCPKAKLRLGHKDPPTARLFDLPGADLGPKNRPISVGYPSSVPLRSIESDWPPAMDSRVGRRGLEPLTPCASCKCATSCANGPSATLYRLHPVNRATHQTCSSLGVPTVRAQRSSANRSQLSRSDAPKPKISTVTGRIRHSGSTITEQKAIAHHVHDGLQLAHLVTHNSRFPTPCRQVVAVKRYAK